VGHYQLNLSPRIFQITESKNNFIGGGFEHFSYFHPEQIGEDEPILTSIFFKGVATTNYKFLKGDGEFSSKFGKKSLKI